jgi:hypothetical protein
MEVAHVGVLFGFVTLGCASYKEWGIWSSLGVVIVGLILTWSAARNAYTARSTALVDKYDERFFQNMSRERRSAALFLLGENSNSDELEDVFDFFESPIAKNVSEGSIDAKQVYDTFYHWIRLYYQAGHKFLEHYRKDEPAAYAYLGELYALTSKREKKEIEKELGRTCTLDDLLLSKEDLTKYLRQEANLKTETSDWDMIFGLVSRICG